MSYCADKQVITAHTDGRTDGRTHRQAQATTIPEGQNSPWVKIGFETWLTTSSVALYRTFITTCQTTLGVGAFPLCESVGMRQFRPPFSASGRFFAPKFDHVYRFKCLPFSAYRLSLCQPYLIKVQIFLGPNMNFTPTTFVPTAMPLIWR